MDAVPITSDPKKLVITTPGRQYNTPEPGGTVVFMGAHDFLNQSVDQIGEYVQQFGTLKTLTIVGHGKSLSIDAKDNRADLTTGFSIPAFLEKLKEIQDKTGIKVADRIVFDACATMTELNADAVQFLSDKAKSLGSEIVGATTNITYNAHPRDKKPIIDANETGLFVAFGPDGKVRRDRLSTTTSDIMKREESIVDESVSKTTNFFDRLIGLDKKVAQALKAKIAVDPLQNGDAEVAHLKNAEQADAKWFSCYDGKSLDEGAACLAGENPLPKARADSRNTGAIKAKVEANDAAVKKEEKSVVVSAVQGAPSL